MRFPAMRKMDSFFGSALCWCAAALSRARGGRPGPPEPTREILIIKFLGFGTIILSMPLVRALRRRFPSARVSYLTFAENREVLEMFPIVDRVLTVDSSGLPGILAGGLRVFRALRREGIDLCINLEFFSSYAALASVVIGARYSMGYGGMLSARRRLFDQLVSYERGRHIADKMANFAAALGGEPDGAGLERPRVDPGADARAAALLASLGPPRRPLVALYIATGEKAPKRKWAVENYADVVRWLLKERGARVLLVGGPSDRPDAQAFVRLLGPCGSFHDLTGRMTLAETAALLGRCDLFLGNDSGPLHLAASLGTRTVSLFGPETPEVYGPPADGRHTALYAGVACSPCLNIYTHKDSRCWDNICLQRIAPGEFIAAVDAALRRPGA